MPDAGPTKKTKKANLDPFSRAKIVTLRDEGYSYREIGRRLKCSHSTVIELCKKFDVTGKVVDMKRSGRPKKSTPRDDRELARMSLHSRLSTSKDLQRAWAENCGVSVDASTIRRRLKRAGLTARRPVKKPFLSTVNIQKRLTWARDHQHWSKAQWDRVLWSDESPYQTFMPQKKAFVRRRPGERYHPDCILPTVKHGGGTAMVWGCMSSAGVGCIQRADGKINSECYTTILQESMLPSAHAVFGGRDWTFQQDNAPCHTSRFTSNYFLRNRIRVLDWPPQSPDMNPIEHLWDELERRIMKKPKATSLDDLYTKLAEVWYEIPPEVCENLVDSMPRRIEALIKARGGATKY